MTDLTWSNGIEERIAELTAPKREWRKGRLVMGLFFVGLLGGAALIPMDAGAVATGVVAVSGSRQAVQHRDGGIVTGLFVGEGQLVKKNDLLVSISEPEVVASERAMAGEMVTLLAQRARLQAELRGARAFADPPEFAALSAQDRALADEAMAGQRLLFRARLGSSASERDVLNQRMMQQRAQIGGYRHQIGSNREQQRLIGEELDGLKELEARGFVAKNRIRAMERGAAELNGNYGALGAEIAKSNEAIGEARMQMRSLERQQLEEVAGQLRDVQLRLDELLPKLAAVREQVTRSMVRAPAEGRVVGLAIHTVGGVVAGGEKLMEVVPQDKDLVIDARVSPMDADDLRPGITTQIRFSAFQERNLPVLIGQISKVSADSFEDERTGMRYFRIEVVVPETELAKIKAIRGENGIKAGLPADVVVPLRKRTALSYLLEPISQSIWVSGREN
jgi:HlyD family secretion protein